MPGETGVTVVTTLVCFLSLAYEAAGALDARHSLRPLIFRRRDEEQNSRKTMRRDREAASAHGTNAILSTIMGIEGLTTADPDAISTPPGTSGLSALELEWRNDGIDTVERGPR